MPSLIIGDNVHIEYFCHIAVADKIIIGNNVLIGSHVFISDHNHGDYSIIHDSPLIAPNSRSIAFKSIYIEDDVWIGEKSTILPGVTIGKGSIIGANAVVTKNIPSFSIAVGAPAKVVKQYNFKIKKWEKLITSIDISYRGPHLP